MQKNDFEKALSLAYFFLKFRPRTNREVEIYLQRRAEKYRFSPEVVPAVVQRLQEENYLNDKKFVEMYVHDRLLFKPRSVFMIQKELQKLGVARDVISAFFESNPPHDQSTAASLLRKRIHAFSHLAPKERYLRSVRYLRSKGFSYGDSVSAYKVVEGKSTNSFEDLPETE